MQRTDLIVLAVDDDARDDIDLILLDIIMPVMNGIEMLKVVRADDNLRQLPIVILTTDETKKNEALESGANGFLMKPIRNLLALHHLVHEYVNHNAYRLHSHLPQQSPLLLLGSKEYYLA